MIVEALDDLFILLTKLTFEMHDGDTDGEEDDDLFLQTTSPHSLHRGERDAA